MSDTKLTLLQKFKALPSGTRTGIIGGVVVASIFTGFTYFDNSTTVPVDNKPKVQQGSLNVGNPGNTKALEGVAAEVESGNKTSAEMQQKIKLLEEMNKQMLAQNQGADSHWSEVSNLVAQVQALQEQMNSLREKGVVGSTPVKEKNVLEKLLPQAGDLLKSSVQSLSTTGASADPGAPPSLNTPSAPVMAIQVVGEEKKTIKASATKDTLAAYIPSGSFFEAELLTGMDASTAISANRNPTPALLRIKSDAILPNMFSFNVRECFALVGGFGNMSTERVEMRTETLSCVSEGGEIYEGKIEAYLVGEDGKAGARGRVVSKQGALLAKSFMAGFIGGIGGAFAPQPVQSLNLGGAAASYQFPSVDQVAGGAISSGLSKSTQALGAFYIKLAEQMFPVVELDAGRKMTIILLKGVSLKMEKKG